VTELRRRRTESDSRQGDVVLSVLDVSDAVRLLAGVRLGDGSVENGGGTAPSDQTFPATCQRSTDGPLRRRDRRRDEAASLRHGGPAHGRALDGADRPPRPHASTSARTRVVRPPRVTSRPGTGVRVWSVQVAQNDSHVQVGVHRQRMTWNGGTFGDLNSS